MSARRKRRESLVAVCPFGFLPFSAGTIPVVSERCFSLLASRENASLMWALMYVAVLYLVTYGVYRRKWFLKF
jgi:predicted acyltransferase